jgi:hypothetical protein
MSLTRRDILQLAATGLFVGCSEKPETSAAGDTARQATATTNAKINVQMRFRGLLVAAVSNDFKKAAVLMMNWAKSKEVGPHVPVLRIRKDVVKEQNYDFVDKNDPNWGVWLVGNTEISMDRVKTGDVTVEQVQTAGKCPEGNEWRSPQWIANAGKIASGGNRGKIKASFHSSGEMKRGHLADSVVVAQFPLHSGVFGGDEPVNPNHPEYKKAFFRFIPAPTPAHQQPLTDVLRFDCTPADAFAMNFNSPYDRPDGKPTVVRRIEFKPATSPVVHCDNLMPPETVSPDIHAHVLWTLAEGSPSRRIVFEAYACDTETKINKQSPGNAPKTDDPVYCPPLLFSF